MCSFPWRIWSLVFGPSEFSSTAHNAAHSEGSSTKISEQVALASSELIAGAEQAGAGKAVPRSHGACWLNPPHTAQRRTKRKREQVSERVSASSRVERERFTLLSLSLSTHSTHGLAFRRSSALRFEP